MNSFYAKSLEIKESQLFSSNISNSTNNSSKSVHYNTFNNSIHLNANDIKINKYNSNLLKYHKTVNNSFCSQLLNNVFNNKIKWLKAKFLVF